MKRFFIALKNIAFLLILPIIILPMGIFQMIEYGNLWDILTGKDDLSY